MTASRDRLMNILMTALPYIFSIIEKSVLSRVTIFSELFFSVILWARATFT